ncbi:hypothetical protein ACQ4PT_027390 [Festuca glaucescens]
MHARPLSTRCGGAETYAASPRGLTAPPLSAATAARSGASVLGGRVQNGMMGGSASAPTTSPPVYAAAPSQVVSFSCVSSSAQHAPPSIEELMQHRPSRTLCYVCHSPTITEAESALADAVTVMIVGSMPEVSRAQLAEFISSRFDIASDLFDVYDFAPEDFLLHFSNNADRNRVLATAGILSAPSFKCTIKPWIRQAHARASSCHYRVVVDILGMPANASCLGTASAILAPCSVFERVLTDRFDRSRFRVAAWTLDPTTIPFASILFVEEPFVNTAGDDTELKLLSYDITIKVLDVSRVDGPPPPPPPSGNHGDSDQHRPRRQYRRLPRDDRDGRQDRSTHGRSASNVDGGASSQASGCAPRAQGCGQSRRQVIDIPSTTSSSSSSAASSAPAPTSQQRHHGGRGRRSRSSKMAPTNTLHDKTTQMWVVKDAMPTSPIACKSMAAAPISNGAPYSPLVVPLQSATNAAHLSNPPDTTLQRAPAASASVAVSLACPAIDPEADTPPVQFMIGSILLSAPNGPAVVTNKEPSAYCPRWDTSPEASLAKDLVQDMVMDASLLTPSAENLADLVLPVSDLVRPNQLDAPISQQLDSHVPARGDGRPGDSMRSCLKVILKKLGIPVEENQGAPPSAAIERYEREFLCGFSRRQLEGLASLYGWSLPSDLELQSQEIRAENPLVVSEVVRFQHRRFHFEPFWPQIPDFHDVVQDAWAEPAYGNPVTVIDHKLRTLGRRFKSWSDKNVGNIRMQIECAKELIFRFDVAQESCQLSRIEAWFRRELKKKYLGLCSLQRTIAHQRSRINWLKEGEANSKKIHLHANHHRRKNFISQIRHNDTLLVDQKLIEEAFTSHFEEAFGAPPDRAFSLNLEGLDLPRFDLSQLDAIFTEEEVLLAIKDLPGDRAPGPDGFTGSFFKTCWTTIKNDIMAAFQAVHSGRAHGFEKINNAFVILFPKSKMRLRSVTSGLLALSTVWPN